LQTSPDRGDKRGNIEDNVNRKTESKKKNVPRPKNLRNK